MSRTDDRLTLGSPKLGDVPYTREDVIHFPSGIPGFEHLKEFLLVTREECAPFIFLTALASPDVALPMLPFALASDASVPPLPEGAGAAVGDTAGATIGWYAVVAIGIEAREVVANLRAPIIVNLDTRRGCQVILEDESLPLCAPIGG